MELKHPEYLAGIAAFILLLFLLAKIRRGGYFFSGRLAVKKINFLWHLVIWLKTATYLGAAAALLIALAAPFTQRVKNEVAIEGKILVPCIDVSGSMDVQTNDKKTKLQLIQDILLEFLKTRSEVDAVGLTAFSGGGDEWGAGILQRPTLSKETFIAASGLIRSQLFGGSTAIGEGIFVSIVALNDIEWNKGLQEESGNPDKELDIRRLWASVNTLDVPEFGLPNTDAKTKDDFIISEAARLTPPSKNKNKIIILFSDGDSNDGLDPIKSIWLAQRLGIKVYYIEVLAAATPESEEDWSSAAFQQPQQRNYSDIPEHRRNLVLAIKRTGGEYFAGNDYNDVKNFFAEVSRLEKDRITIIGKYDTQEKYIFWVMIATAFFAVRLMIKIITNL